MTTDPRDQPYADVERDGHHDALLFDFGPDPQPGEKGYKPNPDEYREEKRWW